MRVVRPEWLVESAAAGTLLLWRNYIFKPGSTRQKANEKLGATNLGELAKKSKASLCIALGMTTGETLYNVIRGIDERKLESDKPRKSVSCDINVSC